VGEGGGRKFNCFSGGIELAELDRRTGTESASPYTPYAKKGYEEDRIILIVLGEEGGRGRYWLKVWKKMSEKRGATKNLQNYIIGR